MNRIAFWRNEPMLPDTEPDTGAKQLAEARPSRVEAGATGQSQYGGIILREYNQELMPPRSYEIYDKMRKGDGKVRAILRIVKSPLLAAQWFWEAPQNPSTEEQDATELVEWAWENMSRTPIQILWEALLMMDFGFYAFEKVFEYASWTPTRGGAHGRQVVKWKKWGPRHPVTITDWLYDPNGGVEGITHEKNNADAVGIERVNIPVEKLLIFTLDEEAGDPTGISILRSAYKHWYYKENLYKVDAIQKERHGIGIPDIVLPPNYSASDKDLADELAKNLRSNEKAFVVRPPGFEVGFLELQGQPVDVLASAGHHDLMIAATVLAQFLNLGSTDTGSRSVSEAHQEIFLKSLRYIADIICGVINKFAVKELVDFNFRGITRYPKLRVRRIGENADFRALSVALRNLVEPGVLTPDGDLEQFVRRVMDLPLGDQMVMDRTVEERRSRPAPNTDDSEGSGSGGPVE